MAAASRLHRARDRRAAGCTLLEGPHLLAEAVEAGVAILDVFALEDDNVSTDLCAAAGIEVTLVSPPVLDRLAPTSSPRGPVAVMRIPAPAELDRDRLTLAVSDPGNAGTLIRSAAAFGLDVALTDGAVDAWSPKVLRAGAGAHFRTRIAQPAAPGGADLATIALTMEGGVPVHALDSVLDPARRWSLLVGSEAHGIAPSAAGAADLAVTIPMPGGTESLNAAVAGSLAAYELARWRTRAGLPPTEG